MRNPWRNVGRNYPCPCGSGKKFKKCCLATGGPPA
ncbi:SEC-C metal-binding domain-containing protein [Bradyrhizobium sp. sBnM-33]|nr:SEC-C metal-binding domain-containing protein [Bradyrhizobium sp. sBnM-33]WOH54592.1 SEC-C metal-binding domain-containing protein [Bradyrhizobium sp. sBnM-33]